MYSVPVVRVNARVDSSPLLPILALLLINSERRDTKDCGIPVGRLFRFIRESSSRRYFPRVHVPIPIGGVVNTVWPGIYPCYLIVSFHSKASSYTAAYTVILTLIPFFLRPPITTELILASNSEAQMSRVFHEFLNSFLSTRF